MRPLKMGYIISHLLCTIAPQKFLCYWHLSANIIVMYNRSKKIIYCCHLSVNIIVIYDRPQKFICYWHLSANIIVMYDRPKIYLLLALIGKYYCYVQSLQLTNIILGQLVKSLIVSIFCKSISTIDEHNILQIYLIN
jgi:hypothetical protein